MSNNLKYLFLGLLSGLFAAALILILSRPANVHPVTLLPTRESGNVTVYITGAVKNPGVYELPAGSRTKAAVEAAGGFLTKANVSAVNLAAVLFDEQAIFIPLIGDPIPSPIPVKTSSQTRNGQMIDLNTASVELLDELPGIGPTKAEEIILYRQKNGAFDTIEEILNVPGIGPGIFEEIRYLITVSSPTAEEGWTDEP